ncbi:hypothetical protein SLE2022_164730 [Rubroshorea leprosula]
MQLRTQDDSMEEEILFFKFQQQKQQVQSFSGYGLLDEHWFDIDSPPIQTNVQEITKLGGIPNGIGGVETKKEKKHPFSLASLELLNRYRTRLNREGRIERGHDTTTCKRKPNRDLSTEEIMSVAGEMFIQSSHLNLDGFSTLRHPFDLSLFGLSDEEAKDIELANLLLVSAEKVGHQQYDHANILLKLCDKTSSKTGNPVQRLVYYFSEALLEKID